MAWLPPALCTLGIMELEDVQWWFPVIWIFPGSNLRSVGGVRARNPPGFLASRLAFVCCDSPHVALELVQKWPDQFPSQSCINFLGSLAVVGLPSFDRKPWVGGSSLPSLGELTGSRNIQKILLPPAPAEVASLAGFAKQPLSHSEGVIKHVIVCHLLHPYLSSVARSCADGDTPPAFLMA